MSNFTSRVRIAGYKGSWSKLGDQPWPGEDLAKTQDRLLWELEIHTGALRRAMKRDRAGEKVDLWDYRKAFWLAYDRIRLFAEKVR